MRTPFLRAGIIGCILLTFGLFAHAANLRFSVGEDALQSYVDTLFPLVGEDPLVTITMNDPRIVLNKRSDRVGIRVALQVNIARDLVFSGTAMIDGRPRVNAEERALYLNDAAVKELVINDVAPAVVAEVQSIAGELVRQALNQWPIYHFDPSESDPILSDKLRGIEVRDGRLVLEVAAF
jgi:hypothetical protein